MRLQEEEYFQNNSDKIKSNLIQISKTFSGSWLGYHSKVYYEGFQMPRPGDRFSVEWGLMHAYNNDRSKGWIEATEELVKAAVMQGVDKNYEESLNAISKVVRNTCEEMHSAIDVLLHIFIEFNKSDLFDDLKNQISNTPCFVSKDEFILSMRPRGTVMSRDSAALTQGYRTPPHIEIEAWHKSQLNPFERLSVLISIANKLYKYMETRKMLEFNRPNKGSKIFIGHGQSKTWKELTYYLKEKNLEWDEFEREPTAGLTIKERLETMLDQAAFALLVMTSEDQHKDESLHARENVVHELALRDIN